MEYGKLLSFKPVTRNEAVIGHEFQVLLPTFLAEFKGEERRNELGSLILVIPKQMVRVPPQKITVCLVLNERYGCHIIESTPTLVYAVGRLGNETPVGVAVIIPPKTFRFWPPCLVRYQICENRLQRYATLPDDHRIRPVEEKYPTTDSFLLMAWKE